MLFFLVLLYVLNGQLVFEKPAFKTLDECQKAGQARIEELQANPSMDGGLFAQCVQLPGQAVKS